MNVARWMIVSLVLAACGSSSRQSTSSAMPNGEPEEATSGETEGEDPAQGEPTEDVAPAEPARAPAKPVSGLAPEMQTILDAHNRARSLHCAPPLGWSTKLAASAQAWADSLRSKGCAFEHSQTKYGENLAAGSPGALDAEGVAAMWYDEIAKYNFKRPGFSMATGHFTQVVWRKTSLVGCGRSTCSNGMEIWVCQYDPPGNFDRQFQDNVLPKGCK